MPRTAGWVPPSCNSMMRDYIQWRMLARNSRQLRPNVQLLEKKCLGIVWHITKLRLYLAGKAFILQYDHKPLAYIDKNKNQNDRIMLWALALQGYDYTVQDISEKDNVAADYLSRMMN